MKNIVYTIIICCMTAGGTFAQSDQFTSLSENAIKNLICSITNTNYKFYGLSSADVLNKVRIGNGIVHHMVALEGLKSYNETVDPRKLIQDMGFATVPLYGEKANNLECFILFNKESKTYKFTGIGDEPYSERFLTYLNDLEDTFELRLVRVPGLNKAYVAMEIEGVLQLISLTESNKERAVPRPAAEVFGELAKQLPKEYNVPR